jgi:endonuclease/exonuclease/phosphatase family metal-dependent hydrolase
MLTVMSFNTQHCLNYLTQQIDYDVMAEVMRTCGAEIVGLQEMRDEGDCLDFEPQARILAEKLGYSYYSFAKAIDVGGNTYNRPYGNALISKYPILSAETVAIPVPEVRAYEETLYAYEDRCLLKATVEVNGEVLTVLVSHFGLYPDESERAVNTVLANLSPAKTVVMGDFNLQPDDALLLPIREKLFDTAELFEEPKFSHPSDAPTIKIDYIFTTRDINVLEADIPAIVASDHRPYTAVIEW